MISSIPKFSFNTSVSRPKFLTMIASTNSTFNLAVIKINESVPGLIFSVTSSVIFGPSLFLQKF